VSTQDRLLPEQLARYGYADRSEQNRTGFQFGCEDSTRGHEMRCDGQPGLCLRNNTIAANPIVVAILMFGILISCVGVMLPEEES